MINRRRRQDLGVLLISAQLLVGISACAKNAGSPVPIGKITEEELTQVLGEPLEETPSQSRPQAKIFRYDEQGAGKVDYQVEEGWVVARFRNPLPHERTLQYWRHTWRGQEQKFEEIKSMKTRHGGSHYQLRSVAQNIAVIYESDADQVTRVVEYAKP